jgi:hypothetical protein
MYTDETSKVIYIGVTLGCKGVGEQMPLQYYFLPKNIFLATELKKGK